MKESREETGESTIKHPVSHTHPFSLSLSLSHPLPTFSWCVSHDLASRWYNRLLGRNQNDPVRSMSDTHMLVDLLSRSSELTCRDSAPFYMYTLHIYMYMYMMTTVHVHVYVCTVIAAVVMLLMNDCCTLHYIAASGGQEAES